MKVKVKETLKNYKGEDIKENNKPMQVLDLLITTCLVAQKDERQSGEEMRKLYKLLKKIDCGQDEVEISTEEISLLKKKSEIFGTLVHGALEEYLEGGKAEVQPEA